MKFFGGAVWVMALLLGPAAFLYSWWFYWTGIWRKRTDWRSRVTLLSLVLLSLAVLCWPIMMAFGPVADWRSGARTEWINSWDRAAFRTLLAALVMSLFGKPKLIFPIVVACIGIAFCWAASEGFG